MLPCPEHSTDRNSERQTDELPFALQNVGITHGQERSQRIHQGNNQNIGQRLGHRNALMKQQDWNPGSKPVETDCLEGIEDGEHGRTAEIIAAPDFCPDTLLGDYVLSQVFGWSQWATGLKRNFFFDFGDDLLRFMVAAMQLQPARRFGKSLPQKP